MYRHGLIQIPYQIPSLGLHPAHEMHPHAGPTYKVQCRTRSLPGLRLTDDEKFLSVMGSST